MANERLDRFTKLLKEIFELDKSDLDFGIYRVMNLRKTQIEEFLTQRLPQMVQETLAPFAQGSKEEIRAQMAEIETNAVQFGMALISSNRHAGWFWISPIKVSFAICLRAKPPLIAAAKFSPSIPPSVSKLKLCLKNTYYLLTCCRFWICSESLKNCNSIRAKSGTSTSVSLQTNCWKSSRQKAGMCC